jgi:hypothetical protein
VFRELRGLLSAWVRCDSRFLGPCSLEILRRVPLWKKMCKKFALERQIELLRSVELSWEGVAWVAVIDKRPLDKLF